MAKREPEPADCQCPVYRLVETLRGGCPGAKEFAEHVRNAKVELLLAVRGLIDRRIEVLKKKPASPKPRSRRIEVKAKE